MLTASENIALLFQKSSFLDVTDDNEERPWDQAYVALDVVNIVCHKLSTPRVLTVI